MKSGEEIVKDFWSYLVISGRSEMTIFIFRWYCGKHVILQVKEILVLTRVE